MTGSPTALPRILIIGKNGQVGWELVRCCAPLGTVLGVDYPEIDLRNPDAIRDLIRSVRPQILINAAAYTAVDKAEAEPDVARQINGVAPGVMAEETRQLGGWMVHYSTDYIFGGDRQVPYVETDSPAPLGVYGKSKLEGDEAVRAAGGSWLIFRLCWVYGARGQNFMLTMQRLAREREELRVVQDQTGCPTWSRLIAEATAGAIRQALGGDDSAQFTGVYHMACGGTTTWHGFASAIVDRMNPAERRCRLVRAITTADYPTPARRPAYSVLNCGKLARVFRLQLPDWSEALQLVTNP